MKRLLIIFFYDKDGIVDEYFPFFVRALSKGAAGHVCIVVNGNLTQEGKGILKPLCDDLIVRENIGMDAWAYKCVLDRYGRDKVKSYDEVICTNFTFFGPIFDMSPMFSKMDASDCDWWGLYRQPVEKWGDVVGSGFICYKHRMLESDSFWEYWEHMPPIRTYSDSVNLHELRQNAFWRDHGFKEAVAFTYGDVGYVPKCVTWPLFNGHDLVKAGCPLVKRRMFYIDGKDGICQYPWSAASVFTAIGKARHYPIGFIADNIRRTQPCAIDRTWVRIRFFFLCLRRCLTMNRRARWKKLRILIRFMATEQLCKKMRGLG